MAFLYMIEIGLMLQNVCQIRKIPSTQYSKSISLFIITSHLRITSTNSNYTIEHKKKKDDLKITKKLSKNWNHIKNFKNFRFLKYQSGFGNPADFMRFQILIRQAFVQIHLIKITKLWKKKRNPMAFVCFL